MTDKWLHTMDCKLLNLEMKTSLAFRDLNVTDHRGADAPHMLPDTDVSVTSCSADAAAAGRL